ncbi:ABC transporter substrate-binding protein [Tateyamaria omphalii]|uniref:ABC transporter substrate-binding protein n=1 Tax=Tateyamaria omphalii TaxID=299262 RepID=UPI001C99C3D7|nr:ABC transporter substrate-binding protein [Tateyamaria omphalii]MBY5932705.1 ABC transporter substrate-binding protein [Tateyamaria omphalii]
MSSMKHAAGAAFLSLMASTAMACEVTVGVVLELTGPAGAFGQAGAKSIEMAFRDINDAGGVIDGCTLVTDTRDSQSQGNVAVDQATQLVSIGKVPVVIGGIISSVSVPVLTSVTAPGKIVQMSPASSSPTLTQLGREGKTGGYFFRTITSDALQGVAAAKYARDNGLDNLAIIHVNNDFGVNLMREFTSAFEALGGTIKSTTPYNENQANYASEVTAALSSDPETLYLISYPVDGATIARTWISQGGPRQYLFNDGMNAAEFIEAVGPKFLEGAFGTSSGTTETKSTEYFYANYGDVSGGFEPSAPAADRSYDAGAIVGLAIAKAGVAEADAIRDAIRDVVDPAGEPIYAGPEEFEKALGLIAEGKAIKYEGVIGPVAFDDYGDISGPFRLWQIVEGEAVTTGQMTTEEVAETVASIQ